MHLALRTCSCIIGKQAEDSDEECFVLFCSVLYLFQPYDTDITSL